MAETLISPGVLARENDQSQVTSQPVEVGAAIVGPTVKGKVNVPTIVTSYSEYVANFGSSINSGSDEYSFLTSISAYNYFENGGATLLVTRVAGGNYTPATSSFISGSTTGSIDSGSVFELETLSDGAILNSDSNENNNGVLESGSKDNIRWEITSPDTSSGTFTLLIRRGDDNTKRKSILESYTNVSLDPKSSNYIAKIIGDQTQIVQGSGTNSYLQTVGNYPNSSRYVRVKSVNLKTPDFFESDGSVRNPEFQDFIPTAQSGTMGGAEGELSGTTNFYEDIDDNDSQGVTGSDYTTAFSLLANKDEFRYNVITAPGLLLSEPNHSELVTLVSNTENRGDALTVVDLVPYNSTVEFAIIQASSIDNSYAASYWPWVQVTDPNTRRLVWIPASTLIPGVYASNDNTAEAWFAPAGINRGGLGMVNQAERKLPQSDRDDLYRGKVNPIATFPGRGVVVFGQKTLQEQASALDRINVRRLLIELKSFISQVADNLVFEQNTQATRNQFLGQVNPFLESVQQRQGLFAFKVVMDNSNNTADVIDRNQLVGAIYIQPTKTAEFIYLDFNILPTGASFPT